MITYLLDRVYHQNPINWSGDAPDALPDGVKLDSKLLAFPSGAAEALVELLQLAQQEEAEVTLVTLGSRGGCWCFVMNLNEFES